MPAHPSTIRATIVVALKTLPKDVRTSLSHRDWQVREKAEHTIALTVMEAMSTFIIDHGPLSIAVAPSQAHDGHDNPGDTP